MQTMQERRLILVLALSNPLLWALMASCLLLLAALVVLALTLIALTVMALLAYLVVKHVKNELSHERPRRVAVQQVHQRAQAVLVRQVVGSANYSPGEFPLPSATPSLPATEPARERPLVEMKKQELKQLYELRTNKRPKARMTRQQLVEELASR